MQFGASSDGMLHLASRARQLLDLRSVVLHGLFATEAFANPTEKR